ncbi:uncharacterized protein LOC105431069 [Pogonomyrmex barbatus]|uniref:Uncharacterized protein LOC105431069 n=1 Tax=Pogonomyrmex barbatus TaxID=144034 RepID=A0A6I9WU49_9HYME|nr:uncharacterized protein LOC105431069 [Pogonomyrmex barbatus]
MSELKFSQKHPILLPSRHFLTDLIIRETHERYYHAGSQMTLYTIRQKFWPLDGRNQVRKVVRSCVRYFRFCAIIKRVHEAESSNISILHGAESSNISAPHEAESSTISVLSRPSPRSFTFIARWGIPSRIYSDNGTNFRSANNQFRELYMLLNSDEHKNMINRFSTDYRITWHFIPPVAPYFGGLWEATVKSFKHHFRRVVGELLFIFEELNTFAIEVEGILNSRPISALSSDPNDLLVLTPAHCLIGGPLISMPELDLIDVPANHLST